MDIVDETDQYLGTEEERIDAYIDDNLRCLMQLMKSLDLVYNTCQMGADRGIEGKRLVRDLLTGFDFGEALIYTNTREILSSFHDILQVPEEASAPKSPKAKSKPAQSRGARTKATSGRKRAS